jgi:transposase-like protein
MVSYRFNYTKIMNTVTITEKDRQMAKQCLECPVCTKARVNQKGFFFWFVKRIEGSVCPYCKAYEKVYGKKAHERLN